MGELELVHEVRLETVFPKSVEKAVINAMIKSHPYEEVAYDIYPVEQTPAEKGLGRVGTLKNEMTLKEFALFVKDKLDVNGVRMVGDADCFAKKTVRGSRKIRSRGWERSARLESAAPMHMQSLKNTFRMISRPHSGIKGHRRSL